MADAAAMNLVLLQLIGLLAGLSMLGFGGGNDGISDMQRYTFYQHHWHSPGEFLDRFAISRAAPGPGVADRAADRAESRWHGGRCRFLRRNVRTILSGRAYHHPLLTASRPIRMGARSGPDRPSARPSPAASP
jgi:hypothetical protein